MELVQPGIGLIFWMTIVIWFIVMDIWQNLHGNPS